MIVRGPLAACRTSVPQFLGMSDQELSLCWLQSGSACALLCPVHPAGAHVQAVRQWDAHSWVTYLCWPQSGSACALPGPARQPRAHSQAAECSQLGLAQEPVAAACSSAAVGGRVLAAAGWPVAALAPRWAFLQAGLDVRRAGHVPGCRLQHTCTRNLCVWWWVWPPVNEWHWEARRRLQQAGQWVSRNPLGLPAGTALTEAASAANSTQQHVGTRHGRARWA